MSKSLAEALPEEMARVRDKIMPLYLEIGEAGLPALIMMRAALDSAAKAMANGDVNQMLYAYNDLKGFTA